MEFNGQNQLTFAKFSLAVVETIDPWFDSQDQLVAYYRKYINEGKEAENAYFTVKVSLEVGTRNKTLTR